jgi:hypothetical protein
MMAKCERHDYWYSASDGCPFCSMERRETRIFHHIESARHAYGNLNR